MTTATELAAAKAREAARIAAVHKQLADAEAHAVGLRTRHAEITAKLDALKATRGASLIEHRFALAVAKAAKKRKPATKPLETLPLFAKRDAA